MIALVLAEVHTDRLNNLKDKMKMKICLLLLVIAVLLPNQIDGGRTRKRRPPTPKTWFSELKSLCRLDQTEINFPDVMYYPPYNDIIGCCPFMASKPKPRYSKKRKEDTGVQGVPTIKTMCDMVEDETRDSSEIEDEDEEKSFDCLQVACPAFEKIISQKGKDI